MHRCASSQHFRCCWESGSPLHPLQGRRAPVSPCHSMGTYPEKDRQGVAVTLAPGWPAGTGSAAWPWGDAGSPGMEDKEKKLPLSAHSPCPRGLPSVPIPIDATSVPAAGLNILLF